MIVSKRCSATWTLTCIIFVAINLRLSLASVGPLVSDIRSTFELSNSSIGLLTTLPLLLFGAFSSVSSVMTSKMGMRNVLLASMLALSAGIAIRSIDLISTLFIGTFFIGIAIAIGNVSLPVVTKHQFEKESGKVTGYYSATMSTGAALGAGLSVPLAHAAQMGWQFTLLLAIFFSLLALVVCWFRFFPASSSTTQIVKKNDSKTTLFRNTLAINIALFMGFQSLTFYAVLAWLPAILIERGMSPSEGGGILALVQLAGIGGALIIPILAAKKPNQLLLVFLLCLAELLSIIGILLCGTNTVYIPCLILGFVLGGTFSLSLLFIVLRANTSVESTRLSGFAQTIGYCIAASGPFLFGVIHDIYASWDMALYFLFIVLFTKLLSGLRAGRNIHI